ncbi:MAG TPA: N-6 DNA methylase [Vicinamibacterales bacterium]|nr:N-6 DNA methylase [Vicinamibacterales bacterium]
MNRLPGVGGSLFPGQYLATRVFERSGPRGDERDVERRRRQLERWWQRVAATCGPATGLRALFDEVAMPLFAMLGFRASAARFDRTQASARLDTPRRVPVGLLVTPWAHRPSGAWRDVVAASRAVGAEWCFVLGAPFLSLVDARGHAARRSVDFTFPDVLAQPGFAPFWTLAHSGAFEPEPSVNDASPASRLDALLAAAAGFQDRVRSDLQAGVGEALHAFGGVLRPAPDAFDQSLTLVYRVLFLLFAESRDLVPRAHPVYGGAYTVGGFCRDALDRDRAGGLWDGLAAVSRLSRLGGRTGDLIVRPFNGRLFARASAPALEAGRPVSRPTRRSTMRDAAAQHALLALGTRRGDAGIEGVNYADLGVEQLGAVYERVLDLDPSSVVAGRPGPPRPAGSAHSARRKQSATFYTPQPLADFLVRRTLAPLVAGASADDILSLRIVDPAMGSGAFLVAACRYLAAACARALIAEGRCAEADLDEREHANLRRQVAERCLAGVDANPVAVQLARLSLWLTTLARGKPLGFLDHRLRSGNSLIGASPDDLRRLAMRRRGTADLPLLNLDAGRLEDAMSRAARPLLDLGARRDDTVDDVRAKEAIWARLAGDDSPLRRWRQAADLWCARWFWPGRPPAPAEIRAAFDALLRNDATLGAADLARWQTQARDLARTHGFFHWPLEFADVFYDAAGNPRPRAGFDAVLGNPPWEMLRNDAGRNDAGNIFPGTSGKIIPASFLPASFVRFIRDSGLYPSCDHGHVNLYQPFLERALSLARPGGRVGLILPWGLAVDDGAAALRARLLDRSTLETVVGLDNADALFPIHRGVRFLVLVARTGGATHEVRARFGVRTAAEIDDLPACDDPAASAYPIRLTPAGLAAFGGTTRRIPDARSPRDLDILEHLSSMGPQLGHPGGWGVSFGRELNATEDRDAIGSQGLPVIEGKHLRPFSVDTSASSSRIAPAEARRRLPHGRFDVARLAYRDVSAVANRQSLIAAIVPAHVVTTHTLFCLRTPIPADQQDFLCGLFNSYVLNALVRMLMGGHLTTSLVEDLPVPRWTGDDDQRRIVALSRRLRRRPASPLAHAALQALVARLYRLDAAMFEHIVSGFPLVPEADRRRTIGMFAL